LETPAIDWKHAGFDPNHGGTQVSRQAAQPGGATLNPIRIILFVIAVAGLAGGLFAPFIGLGPFQGWIWGVAAGAVLAVLLVEIATSLANIANGGKPSRTTIPAANAPPTNRDLPRRRDPATEP